MIRLTCMPVGDVVDGLAQDERAALVEQADGALLVLAGQLAEAAAEVGLDGLDQPVEGAVQRGVRTAATTTPSQTSGMSDDCRSSGRTSVAPTASSTGLIGVEQLLSALTAPRFLVSRRHVQRHVGGAVGEAPP